ncbi:MAG: carbohydrate-binding family 9-like protein [Terriglobia bacterium]
MHLSKFSRLIGAMLGSIAILTSLCPACGSAVAEGTANSVKPPSPYTSEALINSKFLSRDFLPDGDLNKKAWKETKWVRFSHDAQGSPDYPQAMTEVASRWTTEYVYFAFRCKYSVLNIYEGEDALKERWELWDRDVAEVFINPQPERIHHYYEFEVAPNNMWIDLEIDKEKDPFTNAKWNSQFDHVARIDERSKHWSCEVRIPVKSMKASRVYPGAEWRINFFRADGQGESSQRRFLSWSTTPGSKTFHVPERFGRIRFVK